MKQIRVVDNFETALTADATFSWTPGASIFVDPADAARILEFLRDGADENWAYKLVLSVGDVYCSGANVCLGHRIHFVAETADDTTGELTGTWIGDAPTPNPVPASTRVAAQPSAAWADALARQQLVLLSGSGPIQVSQGDKVSMEVSASLNIEYWFDAFSGESCNPIDLYLHATSGTPTLTFVDASTGLLALRWAGGTAPNFSGADVLHIQLHCTALDDGSGGVYVLGRWDGFNA